MSIFLENILKKQSARFVFTWVRVCGNLKVASTEKVNTFTLAYCLSGLVLPGLEKYLLLGELHRNIYGT